MHSLIAKLFLQVREENGRLRTEEDAMAVNLEQVDNAGLGFQIQPNVILKGQGEKTAEKWKALGSWEGTVSISLRNTR